MPADWASSFETARTAPPQDEEEVPRMWRQVLTLRRAAGPSRRARPERCGEAAGPFDFPDFPVARRARPQFQPLLVLAEW